MKPYDRIRVSFSGSVLDNGPPRPGFVYLAPDDDQGPAHMSGDWWPEKVVKKGSRMNFAIVTKSIDSVSAYFKRALHALEMVATAQDRIKRNTSVVCQNRLQSGCLGYAPWPHEDCDTCGGRLPKPKEPEPEPVKPRRGV